jgi:hypothetical protein
MPSSLLSAMHRIPVRCPNHVKTDLLLSFPPHTNFCYHVPRSFKREASKSCIHSSLIFIFSRPQKYFIPRRSSFSRSKTNKIPQRSPFAFPRAPKPQKKITRSRSLSLSIDRSIDRFMTRMSKTLMNKIGFNNFRCI